MIGFFVRPEISMGQEKTGSSSLHPAHDVSEFDRPSRPGSTTLHPFFLQNILTVTGFLRRTVDGLPSTVALGQVGPVHPHVVPDVEVPTRVVSVAARMVVEFLAAHVDVRVDGQTGVGVVGRHVIGHRPTRHSQGPANC